MFSQTAEYALRAMTCLALSESDRVASSTLAEQTHVPQDYLAKVLQLLAKAGLIVGRRGVGGGYRLARDASQIRLLDVMNAVGTIERITTCPLGLPSHGTNLCSLHRKMDEVAKAVIDIFDDATLADLLTGPESSRPLCSAHDTPRPSAAAKP